MFSRILFVCHKVFFHQVNAWLVHGQLIDLTDEFFIHKVENTSTVGPVREFDDAKSAVSGMNTTTMSTAQTGAAGNVVSTILAMSKG